MRQWPAPPQFHLARRPISGQTLCNDERQFGIASTNLRVQISESEEHHPGIRELSFWVDMRDSLAALTLTEVCGLAGKSNLSYRPVIRELIAHNSSHSPLLVCA